MTIYIVSQLSRVLFYIELSTCYKALFGAQLTAGQQKLHSSAGTDWHLILTRPDVYSTDLPIGYNLRLV